MKSKIKRLTFLAVFIFAFSVGSFLVIRSKTSKGLLEIPLKHLKHDDFYYFDVEIEGKKIPLLLDTGADTVIDLQKEILEKIKNKKELGFSSWHDINGTDYKVPYYLVDLIKLEKSKFLNVVVKEESIDSLIYGGKIVNPKTSSKSSKAEISQSTLEKIEKKVGYFGVKSIKLDDFWFFDFPNSKMYCIKAKKLEQALHKLQKPLNDFFNDFVEIPLLNESKHFVINIDTDFGKKALIIDTGTSLTVMKRSSKNFTEHRMITLKTFSTEGFNFGKQEIYHYDFTDKFNYDGIIGIDFLKKRSILLDLKNNRLFISKKASSD